MPYAPALAPWPSRAAGWLAVGLVGAGLFWGVSHLPWHRAPLSLTRRATANRVGPSFEVYARRGNGAQLGRPLLEGDGLDPEDQLVLGIHNAASPGVEAARFAAIFAVTEDREVASLYPAEGRDGRAMALPEVASMALLDGPQLDAAAQTITLVGVFLREPLALGELEDAIVRAAASDQGAPLSAPALGAVSRHVVRLQSMTLTHPGASGRAL